MFHLLTAVSDSRAFPMHRRAPLGLRADLVAIGGDPAVRASTAASVGPTDSPDGLAESARFDAWYTPTLCCGLLGLALLVGAGAPRGADAQAVTPPKSRAERIANAVTAAPEEITRNATVKDWPTKEGEGLALLRQGSNGWVCLPDDPATSGNDPMCMDATFHDAVVAFFAGRTPNVTRVGYAYMLTSDAEGSNTDPRARTPTPDNQWHHAGPHVMVMYPDAKLLDGLPTKPTPFGPYVMFPGTPIAHVMLPVASGYAHRGSHGASAERSRKHP